MTRDIRYMVAWAGDKRSQDALALGQVLARTFDAGIDIVYILRTEESPTLQHAGEGNFLDRAAEQIKDQLNEATAAVDADLDPQAHLIPASSISHGIVEAAQQLGSSMIVIGAGSGAGQPVASPIVGALLHAATVPVAMAPRGYRKNSFDQLEELACAIGTRPGAQAVLEEAIDGVTRVGLPLKLISLVDIAGRDRKASKAAKTDAELALADASAAVADRCEVTTELGKGKNLKQAVGKISWSPRSALIVGSSRLASGRRTFLGTTATRMLTHLPIPMIIVPGPNED